MNRLAALFLVTTAIAVMAAVALGFALIQEADRSSTYSQQSYKNGLRDGEIFTRNQITRAEVEQEIINDQQQARLAEGGL